MMTPQQPDKQTRRFDRAQDVMRRIGMQLIAEKKADIMRAAAEGKEKPRSRDLLTLLLKANMATDIPENQRLSDEDVLGREHRQFSFFIVLADGIVTCFIQRYRRASYFLLLPSALL